MESSFYHVFLSFKGDTRDRFTSFLYNALKSQGFQVFMDKQNICAGDEVDSTIHKGIKNSMSAIIIFSENYPFSTWCLDELVLILKRNKSSIYFILPIFLDVNVKDVKHQLGNYRAALEKHKGRHMEKKVEKWRKALEQVGNILGMRWEAGTEKEIFIQEVVNIFRKKLIAEYPRFNLPPPKNSVPQPTTASTSSIRHYYNPQNDEVFLYTTELDSSSITGRTLKAILREGNVNYVERNCSREPKYIEEVNRMLVGKVKLPTMTVNGKDIFKLGEMEGLDNFRATGRLNSVLNLLTYMQGSRETHINFFGNLQKNSYLNWFNNLKM